MVVDSKYVRFHQACRGKGISIPIPIPFPQDFRGNPHVDPHMDIPIRISIWGSPQGKIIFPFPWDWEYDFPLWRSPYGYPYGENPIPIPIPSHMGDPYGDSHTHGNPGFHT